MDELLVLKRLRMVLKSVVKRIVLDLRCLQRTPTYIHMNNVGPTYLPFSYRNKLGSIIWVQMTYITTNRVGYGQKHIKWPYIQLLSFTDATNKSTVHSKIMLVIKNTFLSQLTSASSQIDLSSNVTPAIPKLNELFLFGNDDVTTTTLTGTSRVASTWTKMSFYNHEFPRAVNHMNI